ncbi:MAG: hypothetical protein VXW91_05510 [Pseudomonadota bacterium]|nr:hypothetical protein [Pseudomonadota bacterium]MEC8665887.1 hypothetical protein [Pseudomonadota bacterium]
MKKLAIILSAAFLLAQDGAPNIVTEAPKRTLADMTPEEQIIRVAEMVQEAQDQLRPENIEAHLDKLEQEGAFEVEGIDRVSAREEIIDTREFILDMLQDLQREFKLQYMIRNSGQRQYRA